MDFSLIEKHLRPTYYKTQKKRSLSHVGLPPQVYFAFITHLDDDYLTDWEVMKFREIFKRKIYESMGLPVVMGVMFYVASPFYLRIYVNRVHFYRCYRFVISFGLSLMSYLYINTRPFPNQ